MGITDTIARIRTGLGEDSPHIADLKELESGINTVKQTLSDQNRVLDDAKRHLTSANNESKERRLANETLEKERDEFKNKLDKFETEFPSMKKELEEYQSYKTSQLDSARTRWNERLGMILKRRRMTLRVHLGPRRMARHYRMRMSVSTTLNSKSTKN